MNTLLIRLEGPMQSWGVQSRFPERDTLITPSKSGIVGLLCAALGRPRAADIGDLAALVMGVRVDREGIFAYDFQTTQRIAMATSKLNAKGESYAETRPEAVISNRYYLADACFLVGMEGNDEQWHLLEQLNIALQHPKWPLSLGRKSYLPSKSVWLHNGLRKGENLLYALQQYNWLGGRNWDQFNEPPAKLRGVIEDWENGSETRLDQPLSFAERRFAPRRTRTTQINLPQIETFDESEKEKPDVSFETHPESA